MYVVVVTVFVKPEFLDQFRAATLDNVRNTRLEPGNVRFDVLQAHDDPGKFVLYEVYHEPVGFTAHQQTAHYARWKSAVTDWMSLPRQAVKCQSLFFGDN